MLRNRKSRRQESPSPPKLDELKDRCDKWLSSSKQPVALPTFYIAKWAILRLMGIIYGVAFAAAWFQNVGLMGTHGLAPAIPFMDQLQRNTNIDSLLDGFLQYPTLFWWIPLNDDTMSTVSFAGMILALVCVGGINSWFLQFCLWLLYFSIVTIASGTSFYAYGWESQILETGFLCIFLCEIPSVEWKKKWASFQLHLFESSALSVLGRSSSKRHHPTAIILWLFQWLMFRISIGAGLIKVRGSSCWTNKTCLYHHFETQPIPSPFSFAFHFLPPFLHRRMVDTDLVVQLYTSFLVLVPACTAAWVTSRHVERVFRWIARCAGWTQAGFMVGILLSGNFSVLNHLTIIPALACLDDGAGWPSWLRYCILGELSRTKQTIGGQQQQQHQVPFTRKVIDAMLLGYILYLSRPVVDNLLSRGGGQKMNASFDAFRLVNTYGAFGSVGTSRFEVILAVSDDGEQWTELEFPCKPGDIYRRPCFCAPYHYRLDWNVWFIGFPPHRNYLQQRERWVFSLVRSILDMEGVSGSVARPRPWLQLMDRTSRDFLTNNYYGKGVAPKFVKADMYRYEMAAPLWEIIYKQAWEGEKVTWWKRTFREDLIRPVTLQAFKRSLQQG